MRGRSRSSSATPWSAFFGLTELHEDDALRAVRAAVELRDAVVAFSDELVEVERDRVRHQHRRELRRRLRRRRRGQRDLRHRRFGQRRRAPGAEGRRRGRSCSATAHTGWSRPTFARSRWSHSQVKGRSAPVRAWRLLELAGRRGKSWRVRHRSSAGSASRRSFARPLRWSRDAADVQALHDRRAGRESGRRDIAREMVARGQSGSHDRHRALPLVRGGNHLPPVDRDRSAACRGRPWPRASRS